MDAHDAFNKLRTVAASGDIKEVEAMLAICGKAGSIFEGYEYARLPLVAAAKNGQTACVKLLLPFCKSYDHEDVALAMRWAASNGHAECVEAFLTFLKDKETYLLEGAADAFENGHVNVLAVLAKNMSKEIVEQYFFSCLDKPNMNLGGIEVFVNLLDFEKMEDIADSLKDRSPPAEALLRARILKKKMGVDDLSAETTLRRPTI